MSPEIPSLQVPTSCCSFPAAVAPGAAALGTRRTRESLGHFCGHCYKGRERFPVGLTPPFPTQGVGSYRVFQGFPSPAGNHRGWSAPTKEVLVSISEERDEATPVRYPALSNVTRSLEDPSQPAHPRGTQDCSCVYTHLGKQAPRTGTPENGVRAGCKLLSGPLPGERDENHRPKVPACDIQAKETAGGRGEGLR